MELNTLYDHKVGSIRSRHCESVETLHSTNNLLVCEVEHICSTCKYLVWSDNNWGRRWHGLCYHTRSTCSALCILFIHNKYTLNFTSFHLCIDINFLGHFSQIFYTLGSSTCTRTTYIKNLLGHQAGWAAINILTSKNTYRMARFDS